MKGISVFVFSSVDCMERVAKKDQIYTPFSGTIFRDPFYCAVQGGTAPATRKLYPYLPMSDKCYPFFVHFVFSGDGVAGGERVESR